MTASGTPPTALFTKLASSGTGNMEKAEAVGTCPVTDTTQLDPKNNMFFPKQIQAASSDQRIPLSIERVASTIPKDEFTPSHQSKTDPVWVYPSEQMFYNAMKRKGWQPNEVDMPSVVAIHNAVNERCWHEILTWEHLHASACPSPTLNKFEGRPKDYSPKARLLNWLGYKLPFDRHDWYVNRCGEEVRYVIDFYNAAPQPGQPIAMHLDVRPALDTVGALADRLRMQCRWMTSGRWMGEPQRDPSQSTSS
uniref:Holocytochrome c-type synthase n=1 Tax=Pyramimonas obovata TaxID=1411642 RepID=A0A7S0WSL6_9CHLO